MLELECREVGGMKDIAVRIMPTRVQKLERLAPDVMAVSLKLPANERLQYLAGQYIDFLLRDGKRRSFSIANAPHDDEFLTLHIREVPGGHSMRVNDPSVYDKYLTTSAMQRLGN